MCSIVGALLRAGTEQKSAPAIKEIILRSESRGRDGFGISQIANGSENYLFKHAGSFPSEFEPLLETGFVEPIFGIRSSIPMLFRKHGSASSVIANLRAEPTTEYVKNKKIEDQQPYRLGPWSIVHNGTIANDKALRDSVNRVDTEIDSAAVVEILDRVRTSGWSFAQLETYFVNTILKLKGSYAILATHIDHPGCILAAANYRPIWYGEIDGNIYFASARDYLPFGSKPQMMKPYSIASFAVGVSVEPNYLQDLIRKDPHVKRKTMVICSGGLDSVVTAASLHRTDEVHLVHFRYGSRAEGPEILAVKAVAENLNIPLHFIPMGIYDPSDSPLLQTDSKIAGGEEGAEFAHEWVPARNLVMLALATAFAEAKGFDVIALGNNLEEAGAYPDNEPEFIDRFGDLLPFAVGDGKQVQIEMPVGHLMKHEIVKLGHYLGAPMHLTWSCYRAGEMHCGTCGPCFMRRTAFEINDLDEVIEYEKES